MHIGRTLPPAAAPIGVADVLSGIVGMSRGRKELDRFQSELKQHFGVKHCFLVSSGKAALALVLGALRELFPGRDEVLIPAFTCYSVPSSIVRARLKVKLCDLSPERLDFDFASLPAILSAGERILAVVPSHLFGCPSDVPRLRALIRDPEITIVEDAAQAMGETWEGKKLGTLGDVGFFSLGRGKAFSAVEGGVILTNRGDIADALSRRIASLQDYGFGKLAGLIAKAAAMTCFTHPLLFWIPRAMPFLRLGETFFEPDFPMLKMSSFQAGLTARWGERLQVIRDARRKNVQRWTGILAEIGNRACLALEPPFLALLRLPVRIRDAQRREALLQESARRGRGVMPAYPGSINQIPQLNGALAAQSLPVAESCAREIVTLPTHGYLTEKDVAAIRRLLADAFA
jgi:dTDP-4-amino-4,6-dideoxygalactose transaminase